MKKILHTITRVVFLIPLVYLLAVWQKLPARIPMHANLNGEVDRYGNSTELVIMICILTMINIGTYLLLSNVHRFSHSKYSDMNKESMQRMASAVSIFIAGIQCTFIYSALTDFSSILSGVLFSAVGLLFSFMGNYMYNIKPNYFAGFRISWTLKNEDNWRKTHHFAGKLWFVGGLLVALICLWLPFKLSLIVFLTIMSLLVIFPFIYSYRIHRKVNSEGLRV
ncbi:MAG: SdpI family protein [Chitinophagaceae bacterium]|nr:SdpI family protein [Chitinophagaceae bacterium]